VSAGFLRRWVFKAFFGYLMDGDSGSHLFSHRASEESTSEENSAIHDDHTEAAPGNLTSTATMVADTPEEPRSNLQTFSPAPMAETFAPLIPASDVDLQPTFYTMYITIGEHTEVLNLPLDQSFMTSFAQGLSQQRFEVYDIETIRCIRAEECYTHFLNNRLSKLQATFNEDTAEMFVTGSKRRRINGEEQIDRQASMDSAKRWLEEEKAKIFSIVNAPAIHEI
jgi:hypothetical protein